MKVRLKEITGPVFIHGLGIVTGEYKEKTPDQLHAFELAHPDKKLEDFGIEAEASKPAKAKTDNKAKEE